MMDENVEEEFVQSKRVNLDLSEGGKHDRERVFSSRLLQLYAPSGPFSFPRREGSLGRLIADGRYLQAGANWRHGAGSHNLEHCKGKFSLMGSLSPASVRHPLMRSFIHCFDQ